MKKFDLHACVVYELNTARCVFRLIFKHLVVVKAKLGLGVGMSIQKFKVTTKFN